MKIKKIIGKFFPQSVKNVYKKFEVERMCKKHSGDAVVCPICNSTFAVFGNFGLKKRENARCYRCGSLERHRLLFLYLTELGFLDSKKNIKLLHFAPEKVYYEIFSKMNNIEYYPCDIAPERYKYTNGATIHKVDITAIPFENNSFDFIICNHVLEHIPNDKLAMDELYRVMSKGGNGYFQVPIDYNREKTYEDFTIKTPKEREIAFGQHDHVRYYGKDYKDRLTQSRFRVNEDEFVKGFSDKELFKYGLNKGELIYYCAK
jgi:SAM-dependent methyltransferase